MNNTTTNNTKTDKNTPSKSGHVGLILGDQLDTNSLLFNEIDKNNDHIFMFEVMGESNKTTRLSSKQRTVLFFSAMRHFNQSLQKKGYQTLYSKITEKFSSFETALDNAVKLHPFNRMSVVLPGDEQVRKALKKWCDQQKITLQILPDQHFITKQGEFQKWIKGKKQPRMEYWYRHLRKTHGILMHNEEPIGGKWNYDADNRKKFSKDGPQNLTKNINFEHEKDVIVKQVIRDCETHLPDLAGQLKEFNWPINRQQALQQLEEFVDNKLQYFGDYQDAMWQNQTFLYHSLISSSLNLKLLNPTEVISKAEQALKENKAPLNAVEGFIRQILGWREYVRGLYWLQKDKWLEMNYLEAKQPLPNFYWDAKTDMNCMQQSIQQVLEYGYGHHIQRLMVTGLYALLLGVKPQQIEQWYLAMYVDAVAWVEQPNTLGMSQYADGGFLASKPYIASGNYINRMSNYCKNCKYKPSQAHGENACPFTTLYWHFIDKHQSLIAKNPRLGMQLKNWVNKSDDEQKAIKLQAQVIFSQN